ncbi:hypothetical protein [uncultured Pseudokineococcus sp.]|uniref:hypothetical protein n=1 Tax=uncultured Pseudokineococcus sp. TaxID=1642928 RepID=UPI00260EA852|nr:hypothetical protein [uncultured Pseudokineococcus sp.]
MEARERRVRGASAVSGDLSEKTCHVVVLDTAPVTSTPAVTVGTVVGAVDVVAQVGGG